MTDSTPVPPDAILEPHRGLPDPRAVALALEVCHDLGRGDLAHALWSTWRGARERSRSETRRLPRPTPPA